MRFGIAVRDITPPFPTPMRGYGVRKDYFDEVNDALTFTAVVLEQDGRLAALGATDLCSFSNGQSIETLLGRVAEAAGCPVDNVLLNTSHTHGGPLTVSDALCYDSIQGRDAGRRYQKLLHDIIVETVLDAGEGLREGSLWVGEGKTGLPMNRRPERDGKVVNAPNPGGPVDDRLTVFALRDADGALAAAAMRASCHPVSVGAQHRITADFPGAWRAAFSGAFDGRVTPLFLQGAGADARPGFVSDGNRWRALPYGELPVLGRRLLAESLDALTSTEMKPLGPMVLEGRRVAVECPCERTYAERAALEPLLKSDDHYTRLYAETCLRLLEEGEGIPDRTTFHVQTLWLDENTALIGTDAEALCGLGAFVEASVAPKRAWVLGYTNGCIAYTPDRKEMARGGYEAESYIYEPWCGPLQPGLEDRFAEAVWRRS